MFNRNKYDKKLIWYIICIEIIVEIILLGLLFVVSNYKKQTNQVGTYNSDAVTEEKKFIKWVDFKVTSEAMKKAYTYDTESYGSNTHIKWIELLAFLGCKYGGDFKKYKVSDMEQLVERLKNNENMKDITSNMKYYDYYYEAYDAVLGGLVGLYKEEEGKEKKYGLKGFFPIAKNYPFSHYDDFGVSREYGYKRKHLGHDMMGQVGTPVINIETGYIEALGWNKYGGWRIGIRSLDKKRYYYYAHLRKNFPYNKSLKVGSKVTSGQVIGYMGRTGYSNKENQNNINVSHLHFGLQLIFDESQKEGNNEIWVDCYELVKFLYMNRAETVKNTETKEYHTVNPIIDIR